MLIKKKVPYIISFFIFAIPILAFLNKINLPQVTALEVYLISFSQFSFFIIMLLLSYFIHSLFLKKKIEFNIFFLTNSFIAFLLLCCVTGVAGKKFRLKFGQVDRDPCQLWIMGIDTLEGTQGNTGLTVKCLLPTSTLTDLSGS